MATKKNTIDWRAVFERGFAERNEREASQWHVEPSTDEYHGDELIYHWHASALGGCVRAAILKRAGLAPDPNTVDSEMNFEFGHSIHAAAEEFLKSDTNILSGVTEGEWSVYSVEAGGAHPTLPLKAKPDAVLWNGMALVVHDHKTEGGTSLRIRKANTKASGASDGVSLGHKIQVTAGAMCTEARDGLAQIKKGMVLYMSKREGINKWDFFTETFTITSALREAVLAKLTELEVAWNAYELSGILPPRLPAEEQFYGGVGPNWRCRARSADDPRGVYCASRSICMALPPVPDENQLRTIK